MNLCQQIRSLLPYQAPFLFVDELEEVTEQRTKGTYTYLPESSFYQGHFPGNPITPGVILIETMAQIGLVSMGIYLSGAYQTKTQLPFAFTSAEVEFYQKVLPGEQVWVTSEKEYFRLGKLKCKVIMNNARNEKVCKGILTGMIIKSNKNRT